MPTLFTLGDSFVTGYDESILNQSTMGKEFAFPKLIADSFNYYSENLGYVGNDNKQILRDVYKIKNVIKPDDIVLVVWSSPFRNLNHLNVNDVLQRFISQINEVESILAESNLIQTQAFSPLVPYEFSKEYLQQFKPKSFLEWGEYNNTLTDFVSGAWLKKNKTNIQRKHSSNPRKMIKLLIPFLDEERKFFTKCMHFNKDGHKIVANFLKQEMLNKFTINQIKEKIEPKII